MEPLLQLHRSAGQHALGTIFGVGMAVPSPAQASSAMSSSSENTAPKSAEEGSDMAGLDARGMEAHSVDGHRQDVTRQMPPRPTNLVIKLGKGTVSSTRGTPSAVPSVKSKGKDMLALMAAPKMEDN